jgi:glycosyltransferase involved in cell wall biosynthesis
MLKHVVQELQSRYPGMRLIILHVVPRGELLRVMRAADLFVLNSWYEGFSHVLLEAAAVGVPILATDVPGNREVLRNEVDALLVPPKAPEALREALERLYRDGKLRGRLADNAKNFSRKFTSQRTVSETKKVLESL